MNALHLQRLANGDLALIEKARAMMERQVTQMVRLVDDLLDVSRITGGKLRLRKQRVTLADVLNVAIESSKPLIESNAHEVTIEIPRQPIYLYADATRLAQVFANLLNNAAKFTGKGGRVWLTAKSRDGEAIVVVRDTGIGIAANDLARIFELFTQVGSTFKRSYRAASSWSTISGTRRTAWRLCCG